MGKAIRYNKGDKSRGDLNTAVTDLETGTSGIDANTMVVGDNGKMLKTKYTDGGIPRTCQMAFNCDGADTTASGNTDTTDFGLITWIGRGASNNAELDTAQKKYGTASMLFDDTDSQFVDLTTNRYAINRDSFTFDCFVRCDDLAIGDDVGIFDFDSGKITVFCDFTSDLVKVDIDGSVSEYTAPHTWVVDTWYHVRIALDGVGAGNCYIFVDGVSLSVTDAATGATGTGPYYALSTLAGGGGSFFSGHIDMPRIFNVALTAAFTPPTALLSLDTEEFEYSNQLSVSGLEAPSSSDLILKMADAGGSNKVSFTDSADAEVANIDSDGGSYFAGSMGIGAVAIARLYVYHTSNAFVYLNGSGASGVGAQDRSGTTGERTWEMRVTTDRVGFGKDDDNFSSYAEKMTIKGSTVGIGNTAPDANSALDVSGGPVKLKSYTVGTVPTVLAGGLIYVSDETGGAVIAFSDGTNWRRTQDRAIVS